MNTKSISHLVYVWEGGRDNLPYRPQPAEGVVVVVQPAVVVVVVVVVVQPPEA